VIHRELTVNSEQFSLLEGELARLLNQKDDVRLQRLRLHDILLWTDETGQRDWAATRARDGRKAGIPRQPRMTRKLRRCRTST